MKRKLIALLEIVRAELNEAISLVEGDEIDDAVAKLRSIGTRLRAFIGSAP